MALQPKRLGRLRRELATEGLLHNLAECLPFPPSLPPGFLEQIVGNLNCCLHMGAHIIQNGRPSLNQAMALRIPEGSL